MGSIIKHDSANTAIIKSYLRTFLAASLAVVSLQLQLNKGRLESLFSAEFAYGALGAGVLAVLGPLARWLDTSDAAFGKMGKEPVKVAPVKKIAAKKKPSK